MSTSMKEQESNKYSHINPSLGADVIFWGIDVTRNGMKKDEGDKVKNFDVHPIHTWVMNVDRNDVIYVWNISTNQKLFHQSITQLLTLTESYSTGIIENGRGIVTTNIHNNRSIIINRNRYQSTSTSMSKYYKYGSSSSAFDSIILGSTVSKDLSNSSNNNFNCSLNIDNQQHIGSGKTMIKNNHNNINNTNNSYINKDTSVKMVKFIDERCLLNYDINNNLHFTVPPTFHSIGWIMIVCEVGVIFHNIFAFPSNKNHDENSNNTNNITNNHHMNSSNNHSNSNSSNSNSNTRIITCADLNQKTPTCAEFIFHNICAIGCSDGIIRIWDCSKWGIIKQLSARGKGDILTIKSLPILRRNIDETGDSNNSNSGIMYERVVSTVSSGKGGAVMREGRIRMLTTGSDGASYIWDAGITGNIIEIFETGASHNSITKQQPKQSSSSSAYKLDQIGASSVAVCQNAFLDEDSNTLFTLSADYVIRLWDLDSLPTDNNSTAATSDNFSSFNSSNNTSPRVVSQRCASGGNNSNNNSSSGSSGFTSSKEQESQQQQGKSIRRGFASSFLTSRKKSNSVSSGSGGASDSDGFTTATSPSTRSTHSTSISHNNIDNNSNNDNNRILQTVGKMKVSASTFPLPSLSKLTSFKSFNHPRYHPDTYLLAAKTNTFAMVQSQIHTLAHTHVSTTTAGGSTSGSNVMSKRRVNSMRHMSDAQATVASTVSSSGGSGDKALKVQPMHFFNLNVLMACYFRHLKHPLSMNLVAAASDPALKIYKIHTHALYTSLVVLATSIGIVVVNISSIQPGPYIGTHPHWGTDTLSLFDNRLLYSALSVLTDDSATGGVMNGTNSGRAQLTGNSHKQQGQGDELQQQSSFQLELVNDDNDNNMINNANGNNGNNNTSDGNNNETVQVEIKQSLILTSSSSSANTVTTTRSPSTPNKSSKTGSDSTSSTQTQSQAAAAAVVAEYFDLKILKSQPVMYSSPSGRFCALFWAESSIYVIIKLNFIYSSSSSSSFSSSSSSSSSFSSSNDTTTPSSSSSSLPSLQVLKTLEGMEVIERGSCLAFGWIGISNTCNNSLNHSNGSNSSINKSNTPIASPSSSSSPTTTAVSKATVVIEDEKYAVLTRGKRAMNQSVNHPSKNKTSSILSSVLGGFRSNTSGSSASAMTGSGSGGSGEQGGEEGEFEPPVLIFKQIQNQILVPLNSSDNNSSTSKSNNSSNNTSSNNGNNTNSSVNNTSTSSNNTPIILSRASDVLRITRLPLQIPTLDPNSNSNNSVSPSLSHDYDIERPAALFGGTLLCITSLLKSFSRINKINTLGATAGSGGSGAYSLTTASVQASSSSSLSSLSTTGATTTNTPVKSSLSKMNTGNNTTTALKMSAVATIVSAQNNACTMSEEGVGNDSKACDYTLKSRFYHITTRRKKINSSTTAPTIASAVATSGDEWELALEPIGPPMPSVTAVSWDYTTSLAAVLIRTRINILRLQPASTNHPTTSTTTTKSNQSTTTAAASAVASDNNANPITMELITLASVDMAQHIYMIPTSLYWQSGILYGATPTTIFMVSTTYPYMFHTQSPPPSSSSTTNTTTNSELQQQRMLPVTTADMAVDVIILASIDHTIRGICASRFNNSSSHNTDSSNGGGASCNHQQGVYSHYTRPSGWLEVVGCQQGKVILSTRERDRVTSIPLHSNSLAIVTILLNQTSPTRHPDCPYVTQAVEWAQHLPAVLHDTMALVFVKRGLFEEALRLPCISSSLAFAINNKRMKNKFGLLEILPDLSTYTNTSGNSDDSDSDTVISPPTPTHSSTLAMNRLHSVMNMGQSGYSCHKVNIPSTILKRIEQA